MTITVLAENTTCSEELDVEHGLSLYLETGQYKLLLDTGASGLFIQNAEKLGIDLAKVDMAFLSHGHYDHGGGLQAFLDQNRQAPIIAGQEAFGKFYSTNHGEDLEYIGLDQGLPRERFRLVGERHTLGADLELFSTPLDLRNQVSDRGLLMERECTLVLDDFTHERSLIVREGTKSFLFTGCAHTGIIAIVARFYQITGCYPDAIIGGFHLSHLAEEDEAAVRVIGDFLKGTGARCLTGHCTGKNAYQLLRDVMGSSVGYLSTGTRITL